MKLRNLLQCVPDHNRTQASPAAVVQWVAQLGRCLPCHPSSLFFLECAAEVICPLGGLPITAVRLPSRVACTAPWSPHVFQHRFRLRWSVSKPFKEKAGLSVSGEWSRCVGIPAPRCSHQAGAKDILPEQQAHIRSSPLSSDVVDKTHGIFSFSPLLMPRKRLMVSSSRCP